MNNVNKYPNSDYIMKNGILIGCHQGLNTKNLDYIHKHITNFVNKIKWKPRLYVVIITS